MTTLLAAISGEALVGVVIWLIVAGLIFFLLTWLIDYCKTPEPFNRVAKVIIAIAAVLIVINALLGRAGKAFISWP